MSTTATVVGLDVNPGNNAQRYILWSNGYVQAIGGAPAIVSGPNWFNRIDQPVGVAMHISDWTTGKGYVLDYTGGFTALNGAPALGTNGYVSGVPQSTGRKYIDWAWDPAGSGKGVVLDHWGQVYAFGGHPACPRSGRRWSHPVAKRLQCHFTSGNVDKCLTLDQYGSLHSDWNAVVGPGGPFWAGWDAARDFCVTDWTNGKGYVLDLYGGHSEYGGNDDVHGFPFKEGVDCGRRHWCLDPITLHFWVVWDGGQHFEFTSAAAPTVAAGGGVNDQQTVTITGSPTAGTFTLTYSGQTTAGILWNAQASAVQAALVALSNIGPNDVEVTGVPGGPWTVEFIGSLGSTNVAQMTAASSLTGGTSPAVTVATLTNGSGQISPPTTVTTTSRPTLTWTYSDPDKSEQEKWQLYLYSQAFTQAHDMTDPSVWASQAIGSMVGYQDSQRGVVPTTDLLNGTYVYYVRVQNKVGLWSVWSSCTWTQNVTPPPVPSSLIAVADNDTFSVRLQVNCTLGVGDSVCFQYSDDAGVTWNDVRGADAVPMITTTVAWDYDVPLGVVRRYRAFIFNTSPRYVSPVSNTATAQVTRLVYVLTSTADPSLGGEVILVDTPQWQRIQQAGVFTGLGAEYPTVVSDGTPKARTQTLGIDCDRVEAWELVDGLIESNSTLLLRDPFGDVMYCRIVGNIVRQQVRKTRYPDEQTPLRHFHKVQIPVVEVQPPLNLNIGTTVPPGPVLPT